MLKQHIWTHSPIKLFSILLSNLFSWSPKRLWDRYQGATTSGATSGATAATTATTTTATTSSATTATSDAGAAHCGTGSTLSAPWPWTRPWTFPWIWPWIFRWTWPWSSICASPHATGLSQGLGAITLGACSKTWGLKGLTFLLKFETKTTHSIIFLQSSNHTDGF